MPESEFSVDRSDRALVAKSYVNGALRQVETMTTASDDTADFGDVLALDAKSQLANRVACQQAARIDSLHASVAVGMARDRLTGIFDAIAATRGTIL